MTAEDALAIFVASDANLEDALPFLAAFRAANPAMSLLMIPRDPAVATLATFRDRYGFAILERDFASIDLLEEICFGSPTTGRLRILAAFDLPATPRACLDVASPPHAVAAILAQADQAAHEPVCVFATTMLALAGPPIGATAMIRAVRENLVAYFTGRPSGAEAESVVDAALATLGVSRRDIEVPVSAPAPACGIAALRDCAAELVALDNGGDYTRIPAQIVGAPPSLACAHAEQQGRTVRPPPALLARLRHATVHGRGVVMDVDGRIVRESLINADADAALRDTRRRPVARRDVGGPLVLVKQAWDSNYGHWLIESLPRLGLVAECHDLSQCRFLVAGDGGAIGKIYRDSLGLMGIDAERIVASSDETLFCEDLIYPAPLTVQPWVKAPRAIRFLEALGRRVPAGPPGPERLYVSRNGTGRRRLRNEAALLPGLAARGYVVAAPEALDFVDQIRLFRDATHVIGNLGAGLANIAFAPPGVRLLALTPAFMQDDFFWDLVGHRAGRYVSLHATDGDPGAGAQADFAVDPDVFWRLLDDFDPPHA